MRCPRVLRRGVAVLVLPLAACGGGGDDGPAFTARDSAGVRIAESARPAWAEGEGWTVGTTPRLEIPTGLRTPGQAVRLADGRVVVGTGWPRTLRVYDAAGARGDTLPLPEQASVSWMGEGRGDSLLAWDEAYKRLLVFAADGRLAREARVPGLQYLHPQLLGRLADGTLLLTEGHQDHVDAASPRRGLVRHLLVGPDGAPRGVFAELPDAGRMKGMEVPFSPRTVAAVRGGEILVGDTRDFEFSVHAPSGLVRTVVRRAFTPLPVTPLDVETWYLRREAPMADLPAGLRTALDKAREARRAIIPPAVFPAYTRLLVDPAGNVWAEEGRSMAEYHARWSVFDPAGRWLGTVPMPPGFDLQQAGDGWVLGTEPNAAGRTVVRLYPLAKTAGQGTAAP